MSQQKKVWTPPTVALWLQWRLDFARRLEGVTFRYQKYKRRSASWDHDHCGGGGRASAREVRDEQTSLIRTSNLRWGWLRLSPHHAADKVAG